MAEVINILTPVGRMVQGNPFEGQTKGQDGTPYTDKAGQPRSVYFFAIAIPKTDPGLAPMQAQIQAIAQAGFPAGESGKPDFSWKMVDGDDPKQIGKIGFPGHMVFRCSAGFAPKVYHRDASGTMAEVVDPKQLKRGDYIRAYISPKANGSSQSPGVYLNPSMIEIVGYGEEIISGPSGQEIFGGAAAPVLPQGASPTPVATGAPLAAPVSAPVTPPVHPGPAIAPVVPPPAPDFLNGPGTAVPVMTAKAGGVTYEAFIAQGWTHEKMVAEGYVQA